MKKRLILLLATALLLASCNNKKAVPAILFDSSEATSRVSTTGGDIAGYVENDVYIYKGIPYGKAERERGALDL